MMMNDDENDDDEESDNDDDIDDTANMAVKSRLNAVTLGSFSNWRQQRHINRYLKINICK